MREEDVGRLSPLGCEHVNVLGRYAFTLPEPVACRELRVLRDPALVQAEVAAQVPFPRFCVQLLLTPRRLERSVRYCPPSISGRQCERLWPTAPSPTPMPWRTPWPSAAANSRRTDPSCAG